ncbi:MAG: KUP/HAK/KT family potassium transporter [Lentisphaerota bacterium]
MTKEHTKEESLPKSAFKSLGVVFGDIGTSPIYTLTVVFMLLKPTEDNVISILSLIVWILLIVVTLEYVWLAMSLSKNGEGGTVVLLDVITPYLKKGRGLTLVSLLAYIGISFLIGDGIITPSISILSAVEGIKLIPGTENITQVELVWIASIIAIILLSLQKRGTDKIAKIFSPIMLIWFLALMIYGLFYLIKSPWILKCINPWYGISFLFNHGFIGFFTLSEVILCATGGEALYADMGHIGRKPISAAWFFVLIVLLINYMGQGAYLLNSNSSENLLFGMVFHLTSYLYIPFLLLSIMATVIASQSMISGIFSIVYQAINLRILPMMKIDFTSAKLKGQIYISAVNWFLLFFILMVIIHFKDSSSLANAYGLAVTGAMFISSVIMILIFYMKKKFIKLINTVFASVIVGVIFASTLLKIPHGGYWSILLACIPLAIIIIYMQGQKRLYRLMDNIPLDRFLLVYNEVYSALSKIKGTALFFIKDENFISPYVLHTMIRNHIIYEDNIFISIVREDGPWGVSYGFQEPLSNGLKVFKIRMGYMEIDDLEEIFRNALIEPKVIFYGIEDIISSNPIWRFFSVIKALFPPYVKFYNLSASKLHGVTTKVNM